MHKSTTMFDDWTSLCNSYKHIGSSLTSNAVMEKNVIKDIYLEKFVNLGSSKLNVIDNSL